MCALEAIQWHLGLTVPFTAKHVAFLRLQEANALNLASAHYLEAAQAGSGLAQLLWQGLVQQAELPFQLQQQHSWVPVPDLKLADQGSTGDRDVSHCSA